MVGTRKGKGVICDISENGLAFITDFPEFLYGIVYFELQYGKWSTRVPGEVVHVREVENKWRCSVKLATLSFEEKKNYNQIVFDRIPTLATEIKTNAMKNLRIFFKRKTATSVLSQRTLPRIPLHCTLETQAVFRL